MDIPSIEAYNERRVVLCCVGVKGGMESKESKVIDSNLTHRQKR